MIFKIKEKTILRKLFLLNIQNLISISIINITTAIIVGIDPANIFLLNGISNIIYLILNKFKFPSYLTTNLMFISPITILLSKYKYEYILSSFILYGILFFITGIIIKYHDFYWLNYILPPHLLGLIITIMGLDLSYISIRKLDLSNWKSILIFFFTFSVIIISSIFWNEFLFVPISIGLILGYTLSLFLKVINFKNINETPWFVLPKIYFPKFNTELLPIVFPIFLISIIEYISFIILANKIKNIKLNKNKLCKHILINSILNTLFCFFGSIPFTFYNESIRYISLNEFNLVIIITSILFIFISFLGKFFIFIQSIPIQIIISISLFIYGLIISSGIKIIVNSNINFNNFQNILLIFITLISGIIFKFTYNNVEIKGLVLTILVGLSLNLLFKIINYWKKKIKNIFFY